MAPQGNTKGKLNIDHEGSCTLLDYDKKHNKGAIDFNDLKWEKEKNQLHYMPHLEPHTVRRQKIMQKYRKEIEAIPKTCQLSFWNMLFWLTVQFVCAYNLTEASWPVYLTVMYIVGATANHTIQIMIHEMTHGLAFETKLLNQIGSAIACIPTGLPSAFTFKHYHADHHTNMGVSGLDVDLPTNAEVRFFNTPLLRLVFMFNNSLFYALRPMIVNPKMMNKSEFLLYILIGTTDYFIYTYMGPAALYYLLLSTFFSMGLHPAAGHAIGEHCEFYSGQESFDYFGFWNFFNLYLGYHIEHHDFPYIASYHLPKVRKVAPEFYENLPYHTSYVKLLWHWIWSPEIGLYSRIDNDVVNAKKVE